MRKVWVWGSLMAGATAMLWFGKVDSAQWVEIANWGFTALVAGNAMEYVPAALAAVRGKSVVAE